MKLDVQSLAHLPYGSGRQTSGGREDRLNADTCGQGGRGQKLENLADVLYGLTHTQKYQLLTNETSTILFLPALLITSTKLYIMGL